MYHANSSAQAQTDDEFGPVVRAYLGYLSNEQNVVDDRASRHEVSVGYYRRNSARIRALRQMAVKIARETETTICLSSRPSRVMSLVCSSKILHGLGRLESARFCRPI